MENIMALSVVKPFKSLNRKFAFGDKITAADIDPGSAFTLAEWQARGFVKDDSAPAPFVSSKSRTAAPSAE